ncbi:MAG: transcriptional regulator, partial [Cyanobacteria bacterium J069]
MLVSLRPSEYNKASAKKNRPGHRPMTKNWALAIGINQYNPNYFSPLRYAKRDAEQMRDFFYEAGFDEVCFFSDDSPPLTLPNGEPLSTYPSCGHLQSFLDYRFERPFLSAGDNCWFFFAGHGMQQANRDYLMPIDANPRNMGIALSVSYVRERLSRSGADNVILMLDACRSEGGRDGRGIGSETQQGIITISACSPTEKSWEIETLQQGAFTYALLEALRLGGERNCATVERLSQYLRYRVPELCKQHNKAPAQMPRISADPAEKLHFILRPQFATLTDINVLKTDAYRAAQLEDNLDLAEQIWIRVLTTAQGRDMEAIRALQKIAVQKGSRPSSSSLASASTPPPTSASQPSSRSAVEPPRPERPNPVQSIQKDSVVPVTQSHSGSEDNLSSEKGIDYTNLRNLLKVQDWYAADQETYRVMITAVGKKDGEWFTKDELLNFPCTDLKTIDRLWVKYSQGRFGFSVQKKIYVECGGKLDGNYPSDEIWNKFGDRVGWRKQNKWQNYSDLNPS